MVVVLELLAEADQLALIMEVILVKMVISCVT